MSGRLTDITVAACVVTIPMVVFSAILLGLVFSHQVIIGATPFDQLKPVHSALEDASGAYLVDINATSLIFIASWSSSLAPTLVGFVLALYTYPVAQNYIGQAKNRIPSGLLTPYQFSLWLRFVSGAHVGAMWNWINYLFFWRGKRQTQAPALKRTVIVTILGLFLATLVFAADTWLHLTTQAISLTQVTALQQSQAPYSMSLFPNCTEAAFTGPIDALRNCSITVPASGARLLYSQTALQVMNNLSTTMAIRAHDNDYMYVGVPESTIASSRDYSASTFAVKSECHPITTQCNMAGILGVSTPYYCSEGFQGDLSFATLGDLAPDWSIVFFTDSSGSSNLSFITQGVSNPFYYGLATIVGQNSLPISGDPEIVTPVHSGIAFALNCSSTVYDVDYNTVNQTITKFTANPSNISVTNIVQGSSALTKFGFNSLSLKQAANVAVTLNTAQELADRMASAFSSSFMAVAAGVMQPTEATAVQQRTQSLVTRIPKAPLFLLVIANLLFVITGIVFAVLAITAYSTDAETGDVQRRMGIEGLVADRFEGNQAKMAIQNLDDVFEERKGLEGSRIVLDRSHHGGYEYRILEQEGNESD
jgi:hypothetical protein